MHEFHHHHFQFLIFTDVPHLSVGQCKIHWYIVNWFCEIIYSKNTWQKKRFSLNFVLQKLFCLCVSSEVTPWKRTCISESLATFKNYAHNKTMEDATPPSDLLPQRSLYHQYLQQNCNHFHKIPVTTLPRYPMTNVYF